MGNVFEVTRTLKLASKKPWHYKGHRDTQLLQGTIIGLNFERLNFRAIHCEAC